MICVRCGADNDPLASFCTRCSVRLVPPGDGPTLAFRGRPAALVAGSHDMRPAVQMAAPARGQAAQPVLAAASHATPAPLVPALAAAPLATVTLGGRPGHGAPARAALADWLPWAVAAAIAAASAAWAVARWMTPANVPPPPEGELAAAPVAPPALPASPTAAIPPPAADPAPLRGAALASAINAGLRRLGVANASVEVAANGMTTVHGTVANAEDRESLLQMIAAVDGVTGVRDGLQLRPPAPPPVMAQAPAPATPVPAPTPEPLVIAKAPPTAAPPPVLVLPPRPAPVEPPAPPPPDPAQVGRQIQRALSQLALSNLTVQVDDTQVTLRGTVNDPAKKSQALAAARTYAPQGKVRDLIFVVEE